MLSNVWFLLYFTGGYCAAQLIRFRQMEGNKRQTGGIFISVSGTSCKPRKSKNEKKIFIFPDTLQNTFL